MGKHKRARYVRSDRWTRFWDKVRLGPTNTWRPELGPCWLWTAAKVDGYGAFSNRPGRTIAAHRWAYLAIRGGCPPGYHLDHLCAIRNCVNPLHLEPVDAAENTRRQLARHLALGTYWRHVNPATHCKRGHLFDPVNTKIDKRGRRACRTCAITASRLRRQHGCYTPRPNCRRGHPYANPTTTPGRHRRCPICWPTKAELAQR